ncbi:MAG: hypothetical protein JSW33_08535 [bacterium]|nr:MAG: hypothetical protein JSW33_08535 [bacterium]
MKSIRTILSISLTFALFLSDQSFLNLSGRSPRGEIIYFSRDNLWEHINGAADQYLDLGFKHLQILDFQQEALSLSIEINEMVSGLNTFGIFALERSVPFQSLAIGSQSVLSLPEQALLLKNIFYVKIYALEDELTESSATMLLKGIDDYLPGHNQVPEEFHTLPKSGRKKNSECFAREAFLGLNELQNCLYAVYEDEPGTEFRLFRIVTDSLAGSEAFLYSLPENWTDSDIQSYPVRMITIPFQGLAAIVLKDRGLLGVSDCRNKTEIIKRFNFLINSP